MRLGCTERSSAVIYPAGPADGCNRSLFKFASEPGKRPGAQREPARKMFTDSGCLTTRLPPTPLPPLPSPPPPNPSQPPQSNTHADTYTCSRRLSVATLLLPLSNFFLSSHLLRTHTYTHTYIHMHALTHTRTLTRAHWFVHWSLLLSVTSLV